MAVVRRWRHRWHRACPMLELIPRVLLTPIMLLLLLLLLLLWGRHRSLGSAVTRVWQAGHGRVAKLPTVERAAAAADAPRRFERGRVG